MRHERTEAIVPVSKLNRATAAALDYASSISDDVLAVHVVAEIGGSPEEFARRWREWSDERIPLEMVPSPYREVVAPLVEFVEERARREGKRVTVVVPTLVTRHPWQEPLHNQLEYALALSLLGRPDVVVTSVSTRVDG